MMAPLGRASGKSFKRSSPVQKEVNDFRLAYSKAGNLASVILVLLGAGLDAAIYPEHFSEFVIARCLVAAATLWLLYGLTTTAGRHWVRPITFIWLSLPQIMIGWMISQTEGAASIYFVGLHLALYAAGIILPISYLEGIGLGVLTFAVYVMACFYHPSSREHLGQFVGHSLFLIFSAVASTICAWFNEKARLHLQVEVAEKNQALVTTNEALAQIKGQLIQQEKMAALGTLSAGLMHEVNNPVNFSLMALNLALMDPAAVTGSTLRESLEDARHGIERVQGIVSDLKTFAYQKPGQDLSRVFLLEKAVRSGLRLSGHDLRGVKVSVTLPQDTHVRGDEPAVIGVLINLFSNAVLAMRNAGWNQPVLTIIGQHRQGRLHLSVRDNGTGIAPENITRVFEPFFTTRAVGQGLGLGLSVSYAIVQRHGGELQVRSEWGAWTEFRFDLQAAQLGDSGALS